MLSGRQEWSLDTREKAFDGLTEAEFYAKSIKDVADHYGSGMLDQKTLDWLNLIQCFALVVGGRIVAIRMTPRVKTTNAPGVHETARSHNPAPSANMHRTPEPVNIFEETPTTHGHVAGVGDIDIPDSHPLSPNYRKPWSN